MVKDLYEQICKQPLTEDQLIHVTSLPGQPRPTTRDTAKAALVSLLAATQQKPEQKQDKVPLPHRKPLRFKIGVLTNQPFITRQTLDIDLAATEQLKALGVRQEELLVSFEGVGAEIEQQNDKGATAAVIKGISSEFAALGWMYYERYYQEQSIQPAFRKKRDNGIIQYQTRDKERERLAKGQKAQLNTTQSRAVPILSFSQRSQVPERLAAHPVSTPAAQASDKLKSKASCNVL